MNRTPNYKGIPGIYIKKNGFAIKELIFGLQPSKREWLGPFTTKKDAVAELKTKFPKLYEMLKKNKTI